MEKFDSMYERRRFGKKRNNESKKSGSYNYQGYSFDDFLSDVGNDGIRELFERLQARAKLNVSQPFDAQEKEADKIADLVVSGDADQAGKTPKTVPIQKKSNARGAIIPHFIEARIAELMGNGSPLNNGLKEFFEPRFGVDLDKVRIHNDSLANRLSQAVHAKAFTSGNDIAFAKGEYQPETLEGKRLLAHEIAHTMQDNGSTIMRKEEKYWLLKQDGTLEFNGGPDLWMEVEYTVKDSKDNAKEKKMTGKKLVALAQSRTVTGSLVEWLGLDKALEIAGKLAGGDPADSATYGTKDKKQSVEDSFADKKRAREFLDGKLKFTGLSSDEKRSILGNIIMDKSNMRYDPRSGWQGHLKLHAGKGLAKYFNYDYKAQFAYLKGIGDKSANQGFNTWYAERRSEELAMIRKSSLYKQDFIGEAYLNDTNLNLTELEFEELEQLYSLHKIDDFKDKAVKQKFVDLYMYTLRKNYVQEYGKPTKCNVMFNDFLSSGAHKDVLAAIYATAGSNEVEKVLKYVAGGDKKMLEDMKNPGNNFRYENDKIVVFASHQLAQDLANRNCDVGVFGKYYNGKSSYLFPHFSMVAPSNITFTDEIDIEKRNFKNYPVFGLDIQPYSGYGTNPNVTSAIGPLLAQVGTANGMVNYKWAYNLKEPKIDFINNIYSGIVYVYFK